MKKTSNSSNKEDKSILCFDDRISSRNESDVYHSSATIDRRLHQDSWHHSTTKRRRSNLPSTDHPLAPAQKRGSDSKHVVRKLITEYSDDGYTWRKYGQKDILGAKYSRAYYRCAYMHDQGCNAKKQVQRVNEGNAYELFYRGLHTCSVVTGVIPGSTSEDSDSQPFRISYGMDGRELEVPTSSTGNMSFSVTEIPFLGAKSTYTPDSEREKYLKGSSQLRQEEPIISSSITADSMLSANDRTKKVGENETSLAHHRLRNSGDLDSNSLSTLKYGGSTDCILQRLFSAFQDAEVKKIGVYGNSGIGKTTLLKAFRSRYDLKRLFDLVLWVTIPKCSSRRKIQNALVQQLSLKVPNFYSDDEVAMILRQNFLSRKFVLILDDVHECMDLQKVGIPAGILDNDYKIILTSRSIQVCKAMEVDRIIEARALSREESLKLFRFHVGHVLDSYDIEPYGRAIVNECSGLPLVIKVAGRALRLDKCVLTWKRTLKKILLTNNLQVLKIGYDRLKENDLRSCFLFSALFIEHNAVKISSLVECLVDEGFVAGSMSDAHRRGHEIIKHLIDVSLLECTDDGSMVEMHGLICDLAFVILSDVKGLQMLLSRYLKSILPKKTLLLDISNPPCQQREDSESVHFSPSEGYLSILKAGEGIRESPSEEKWEEAKMVFLMDSGLSSLPKKPACSKLQILFLQRNSSLRTIPSSFFESMSSLKILNLSKTRMKSLPESLSKLHYLQVFILRNCERLLHLPSAIGALKNLLVLDVHGTEICQLPDQVGELVGLVHLQLCFYGSMDEDERAMLPSKLISKGVISNFSQLRELSIIVYPGDPRWIKIVSDVTIEVSNLKLWSLSFCFPDVKHLEYFINVSPAWLHRTLTHFNFIVGHVVKRVVTHVSDDLEHEYNQQDRCLRFVDGEGIPDAIEKVLHQTTAFYLDHHLTAHSLTQFTWAAINGLKFCIVKDCPQLKAIITSTKATASCFPSLELLSIHYAWNLSQIWVGPIKAGSLSMLRRLSLHSCPKLEFILSPRMVAVFSNLEELVVVDCQSLKSVISNQDQISADEDVGDSDISEPNVSDLSSIQDNAKDGMEVDLPKVAELRIKVLKLHYLPKLVSIWSVGDLPCLEYVSIYNCPRLKNLNLKSHAENTIKEIKTETDWWNNLEWENPALPAKLQSRVKEIQRNDMWGNV